MRNHFTQTNRQQEDLHKQALRTREQQMLAELGDYKKERNFISGQRQEQEQAMQGLLGDLETRNERRMRA
jgi:hypothetical protein